AKGASVNTVNNEVSVVGRGLTVLYRAGRLPQRPPLPWVRPSNARQGFIEPADLDRLLPHLQEPLRAFVEIAYRTGWRRSELVNLTWRQVDFDAGEMRLRAGHTKNNEGRAFPISAHPRVEAVLREQ